MNGSVHKEPWDLGQKPNPSGPQVSLVWGIRAKWFLSPYSKLNTSVTLIDGTRWLFSSELFLSDDKIYIAMEFKY